MDIVDMHLNAQVCELRDAFDSQERQKATRQAIDLLLERRWVLMGHRA